VGEGRRVINNIQRAAALFLVKNIFSLGMALICMMTQWAYPLQPFHLSIISALTIGVPAFFLAMEPNYERVKGRFLTTVLRQALPGGLANIITVFAVFALGPKEAASILFVRVFLGAVFAGNFSTIFYSGAGGLCAILVTIGTRKILTNNQLWVAGALGAVGHSVGQMAMAITLTATPGLAVYLPVMIFCSVVTGLFTGLCAQFVLNRGKEIWKTFLK
jgi:uncharacterized membrane protein